MTLTDDDLTGLQAHGVPPLPVPVLEGRLEHAGDTLWYGVFGTGKPVVLLHGGMGSSENWAYLIPELVAHGYQAIAIDSPGQGRSRWGGGPFSYRGMAHQVMAILDELGMARAAIVGWSDGADTGLVLADIAPERVSRLFFFACNVDPGGVKPFEFTPVIGRILENHRSTYARLSPHPERFDEVFEAVQAMQSTQPDYTSAQLATINVPTVVALGEADEFIRLDHAEYLARALPNATFRLLPDVTHFAPLQRPALFNAAVLEFLAAAL
ncbi:alpha/beta fold hydrolase [Luteibacter sp.]|uniref:alpha/beta fold hydrolase n=1 Tax=Luteibacter sp. TaxID=1886636 RepID=UPI003F815960